MPQILQKDGVTMLNTAQLLGSINVVTLKCPCKQILMGQMGQPIVCTSCNRGWFVSANSKIIVSEVAMPDGQKVIDTEKLAIQ